MYTLLTQTNLLVKKSNSTLQEILLFYIRKIFKNFIITLRYYKFYVNFSKCFCLIVCYVSIDFIFVLIVCYWCNDKKLLLYLHHYLNK